MAMSVPASAAVDAKLLEMLKANGSISPAQYSELQTELASENQAKQEAAADQVKNPISVPSNRKSPGPPKPNSRGMYGFVRKPSRSTANPMARTRTANVFVLAWAPIPKSTRR